MKKNRFLTRMTALLLVLVCMLGLLPTAALAADAPSSIKLEDCTHNGVHYAGTETVSWVCVLGAAPFAALGFFTYHGMAAEQFIWAWLRSEVLEPRELRFEASTLYYDLLKPSIDKWEKEEYKRHD